MLSHITRFRRWYAARGSLWTTVRVAGVAVRTGDGWVARRLLVTLGEPLFEDRVLRTDHVLVFERHLPTASLARILLALTHGRVPEQLLNLGVPMRTYVSSPPNVGSEEHPGRTGFAFRPRDRFGRFELKMSGGGSRSGCLFTNELHELCERELLGTGRGRFGEFVHALGLTSNKNDLRPGADECICELIACIPTRIASFTQTADRVAAVVMTEVAPEIRQRVRLLMTPQNAGWRDPVEGAIDANGRAVFQLSPENDVEFTLLLDNYPVQSEVFKRLPCVRPGLRERAVAMLEGTDRSLVRDGLTQAGEPDANAFERSVIHLFGMLGFSGWWWGPNRQNGKPKMPMPPNASDCLVFSSDDAVVGLIECTVDAPGRDKTLKLIKRAQAMQRAIRDEVGDRTVVVAPVLAAASHPDDISNAVRELCTTDGLVLIDATVLRVLHDLVAIGATDSEIATALPEPLRAGLAADRLFARLF